MLTFDDLILYYEEYFRILDNQLFHTVIDEFSYYIGKKFKFESTDYINNALLLQRNYVYESEYVDLWFELLQNYNFNLKSEMRDVITQLGYLKNPNCNKKVVNLLLNSPVVDDISYNGNGTFTIFSEMFGNISFDIASVYFRAEKPIKKYIRKEKLGGRCHDHTYFLSMGLKDNYSITSLANHYFNHLYYHSYSFDKRENRIVDLCSNAVLEKEDFDLIMEPKEIIMIQNKDLPNILKEVERTTDQPKRRCEMLKIALNEHIKSIDEEEKRKILDYKNSFLH